MTVEEVAQFLRKSTSWVYKNWKELGVVTTTEKSPAPITQNSPTLVFKKSALPSQLSEPER